MRTWNDNLSTATRSLLTAVTGLHNKNNEGVLLRLLTSISDMVHLVEQLHVDHCRLERELRKEQQTSQKLVARIKELERLYTPFERTATRIQSQHGEQESGEAYVRSDGSVGEGTVEKNVFPQRQLTPELKQLHDKEAGLEEEPLQSPPKTPPPHTSAPQQASISPYKPPSPKNLPPLPTLQDVQAEQRQRRSRKRALDSQKPPPCDNCCVKKRAMMFRRHGYVKEDVFSRWSKRPGGCLAFMHYDEPVPEGSGGNLSFTETETESPD